MGDLTYDLPGELRVEADGPVRTVVIDRPDELNAVNAPLLSPAFGTSQLTPQQWLVCLAMASAVLWVSELRKLVIRLRDRPSS